MLIMQDLQGSALHDAAQWGLSGTITWHSGPIGWHSSGCTCPTTTSWLCRSSTCTLRTAHGAVCSRRFARSTLHVCHGWPTWPLSQKIAPVGGIPQTVAPSLVSKPVAGRGHHMGPVSQLISRLLPVTFQIVFLPLSCHMASSISYSPKRSIRNTLCSRSVNAVRHPLLVHLRCVDHFLQYDP